MKTICTKNNPPFYIKGWECYDFNKAVEICKSIAPHRVVRQMLYYAIIQVDVSKHKFIVESGSGNIYIVDPKHWSIVDEKIC